jgi:hypothetical protein
MYIKSRALASLIALAALFGIAQAPPFSQAAGEKKLEVFSWWTSGGEVAAPVVNELVCHWQTGSELCPRRGGSGGISASAE